MIKVFAIEIFDIIDYQSDKVQEKVSPDYEAFNCFRVSSTVSSLFDGRFCGRSPKGRLQAFYRQPHSVDGTKDHCSPEA